MRKYMNWMTAAVCVLALSAYAASVNASTIHVDVNAGQGGPTSTFSGTPATVLGGAGDTWNTVVPGPGTAGSLSPLNDSANAPTGVSISWTANHWSYGDSVSGNYSALLGDYAYVYNGGQTSSTWTFGGLAPNGLYDLVLYSTSGGASFTVGGVVKVAAPDGNMTTLTEGNQYVRYNAVQANGSGNIPILFAIGSGGTYGMLSGLEIQSAVPEPSTIVLLAIGLFGLIAYAWRKQK